MANIQDTSCGRMSPAPSPQTAVKTSRQSSKRSSALQSRKPRCLCLKKVDGPMPTATWETDGALLTEFSMLNSGEFPNEENASTLSQILQVGVPSTYFLSPKACLGILRRASARGKELPEVLRIALEQQASMSKVRAYLRQVQRLIVEDERFRSLLVYYDVDPM